MWLASYEIDGFTLFKKDSNEHDEYRKQYENIRLSEFKTLKEAKRYIREGIKCDMNDLKILLLKLKNIQG